MVESIRLKIFNQMRKLKQLIKQFVIVVAIIAIMPACEDILNVKPSDVLTEDKFYRDKFDADAAIRGVYGKLMDIAPQYVILNELRADLMDVTSNADHHLREIAEHNISTDDNKWVDPTPFFSLINDCNDIIHNFGKMKDELKLSEEAYNSRVSDVIVVRSWLFYQLVLHYGNVPYYTQPIETFEDLSHFKSDTVKVLGIQDMISQLFMDVINVPYSGIYTDETLYGSIDEFHTRTMFIDKQFFLADLALWTENYEFAAALYKDIMERHHGGYGQYTEYDQYKLPYRDNSKPENPGSSKYTSGYLRYFDSDLNSIVNFWPLMFKDYGDANYYSEWIWVMNYHKYYEPSPFYEYFSFNQGKYLFKPSERIIKDWDQQVQANGFLGDFRGNMEDIFGNTGSYYLEGNSPVILKYINEFDELEPAERPGRWPLLRSAGLHLKYAEAANRAGQTYLATSILNNGVRAGYPGSSMHASNDFTYRNISYKTDHLGNIEYEYIYDENEVLVDSTMTLLNFPFNFDARQTGDGDIPSIYRGEYHKGIGVRGRVGLQAISIPADVGDYVSYLEDAIIDEAARELAFEGHRWADLIRISLRRGNPKFLADKVASKFEAAGEVGKAEEVRNKLMNMENWFLPLEK